MPPVKQTNNHQTTHQQVNTVNTQRLTGILSRAIPVEQLPETHIKAIIYGTNRVGKTYLACQFPKPLLLIDCEPAKETGGARSVKRMQGVTFLKLENTADINQLAKELAGHNPFKTVVVDSTTSLERIVLSEILKQPSVIDMMDPKVIGLGKAGMAVYMERSDRMRKMLRPYIDLPCHTLFTAKEKDHNPNKEDKRSKVVRGPQDESFYGPDLGGGTVEWLKDACEIMQLSVQKEVVVRRVKVGDDVIERLEETGRNIRRLRIVAHANFAAGLRCEHADIPEFIDEPSFDRIMSVINGVKV